ncbi:hypothetical protein BAY60_02240 [Prauserella muralis]|uniref:Uncharacterized protein n=2 Tax=Prauserella muralis TaxID=588067 RepID=A0A2V4B7L4_9PSEU|nr:hypothetical protein BAY60_02240 [Prauserella muralis]TWE14447.1 hypothetical protein FHX69_6595 [Prauserella muralis]
MFAHEARLDAGREQTLVRPGFRERVEELMRGLWREPVIVLRLADGGLVFEVPGRRPDGTVEGTKLVRRFFWNLVRGIGRAAAYVLFLAHNSAGGGGRGRPVVHVRGPANAMALDLVDRLRQAKAPWLVFAPSGLAVVDTGPTVRDPAGAPPPQVVWQARGPHLPAISFAKRTLTWPDGSSFTFVLHGRTEEQHLRAHHEFPEIIHWNGRPGQER